MKKNDIHPTDQEQQQRVDLPSALTFEADAMGGYLRLPEIKRLVHRIASTQNETPYKSLIILSEYPGEGRSFLVSLLALAYASILKSRVLILDTVSQTKQSSFHSSSIIRDLSFAPEPPSGRDDDSQFRGITGVDLIATRSMQPSGIVASDNQTLRNGSSKTFQSSDVALLQTAEFLMKPFIAALSPSYDLILLDTCAMNSVSGDHFDPLVLARQIERAVLLLSPSSRNRGTAQIIKKRLDQDGISLMGVIHNNFLVKRS
jgi:Mrp family chromosome partitioning ATPase